MCIVNIVEIYSMELLLLTSKINKTLKTAKKKFTVNITTKPMLQFAAFNLSNV